MIQNCFLGGKAFQREGKIRLYDPRKRAVFISSNIGMTLVARFTNGTILYILAALDYQHFKTKKHFMSKISRFISYD